MENSTNNSIMPVINEIISGTTLNSVKIAAMAVKNKNYDENSIIEFVNTVCSQYDDNPESMEKMIGTANLEKIFQYAEQKAISQDFIVMNKCLKEDMESIKVCCPHCGGTSFTIIEQLVWKGGVDEDIPDTIDCYQKTSGIETITCDKCDEDVSELDNDYVKFNFQ
ncbi:MAG: hypothetical protein PHT69_02630 [Bacteroidales bacterium]|nr:hypothetical protein [Bacteroidales bacterium]